MRIIGFILVTGLLSGCAGQTERPDQRPSAATVLPHQPPQQSGPEKIDTAMPPEIKPVPVKLTPVQTTSSQVKSDSGLAQSTYSSAPSKRFTQTKVGGVDPVTPAKVPRSPERQASISSSQSSSASAADSQQDEVPITIDNPPQIPAKIEFTLEQLPITIGEQWRLRSAADHCVLETLVVQMDDGQGLSKIRLELARDIWTLVTESDIDLSYSDTGLETDLGHHFELGEVVKDTNVAFGRDSPAITTALLDAKFLRVALGFWPTWPVTETKTYDLPVTQFASAYSAWKTCQLRINAR